MLRINHARALTSCKQYSDSILVYRSIIETDTANNEPLSSDILLNLSYTYSQLNMMEDAINTLNVAINLNQQILGKQLNNIQVHTTNWLFMY
jgi:tetratricopeptide (TPR) repeat protein